MRREFTYPCPITKPLLVMAEGPGEARFLSCLFEALGLPHDQFEFRDYGGKDNMRNVIGAIVKMETFKKVRAVLITRDANQNPDAAFQSIQGALKANNLPVPQKPGILVEGPPCVAVWIFPDNTSPGELETLCKEALRNHPAAICVDDYLVCVKQKAPQAAVDGDKAWVYAFLAAVQRRPERRLGERSSQELCSWNLSVFDPFAQIVNRMMLC